LLAVAIVAQVHLLTCLCCVCGFYSHFDCLLISQFPGIFDAVDIFNANFGVWTTAALSIPRKNLAATSLPNHKIAMFAGGRSTSCFASMARAFYVFSCLLRFFILDAGSGDSGVSYVTVDIFNVTAGKWSTASLSAARGDLAATSLPNLGVAIFAGGGGA
jgi:hypothetical protein